MPLAKGNCSSPKNTTGLVSAHKRLLWKKQWKKTRYWENKKRNHKKNKKGSTEQKEQYQKNLAKMMQWCGEPVDKIIKETGLSNEEVEDLKGGKMRGRMGGDEDG